MTLNYNCPEILSTKTCLKSLWQFCIQVTNFSVCVILHGYVSEFFRMAMINAEHTKFETICEKSEHILVHFLYSNLKIHLNQKLSLIHDLLECRAKSPLKFLNCSSTSWRHGIASLECFKFWEAFELSKLLAWNGHLISIRSQYFLEKCASARVVWGSLETPGAC